MARILVPIDEAQGRQSIPNQKFGSSPYYLLIDSSDESNDRVIKNTSMKFGGDIRPINLILNTEPTHVFTRHACQNALDHLEEAGITPYLVDDAPVEDLLVKFSQDKLDVMHEADH